ncbi:hypothetical protein WMY93_003464 [Mugilogobius chulae]|uniref:Syndecan/Neurexin domain-containing protein n=1 Tax=Mugilogobius chulae TaxID=88201 RepID=A0AAW0PYD7_9GOBI
MDFMNSSLERPASLFVPSPVDSLFKKSRLILHKQEGAGNCRCQQVGQQPSLLTKNPTDHIRGLKSGEVRAEATHLRKRKKRAHNKSEVHRIMRVLVLTALLCFSLTADAQSLAPEDLETSGDDMDMEALGQGRREKCQQCDFCRQSMSYPALQQGFPKQIKYQEPGRPWNRKPIIVQESRRFIESKEVLAGVIAGGTGGLVLGAVLAGLLIYKWKKKDSSGYSQGTRRTEQDYFREPRGEDVVLV